MTDSFFSRVRALLLTPAAALGRYQEEGLTTAFVYYIKLTFVAIALMIAGFFIICSVMHLGMAMFVVFMFSCGFTFVGGLISVFFNSFFLHIGVYLLGGRGGYDRTTMAVMYSSTPGLFGFVPVMVMFLSVPAYVDMDYTGASLPGLITFGFLAIILGIWQLVIMVKGISIYHRFSTVRAIFSLVVPIVLSFVIFAVIFSLLWLLGSGV